MEGVEVNTSESSRNEENIMSTVEICRVCLLGNEVMRDLFLESEVASLSVKAMSFASVKIFLGDGLPAQVCSVCAEKLESAYEFKLQVEQADSVLREKYDSLNIKEELFFNEVEVHLESERSDEGGEIDLDSPYETAAHIDESLDIDGEDTKPTLLKDHLALLQVEKLAEQERVMEHEQENEQEIQQEIEQESLQRDELCSDDQRERVVDDFENLENVKAKGGNDIHEVPIEEHDYVIQEKCTLPNEEECTQSLGTVSENQDVIQCVTSLEKENTKSNSNENYEPEVPDAEKTESPSKHGLPHTEIRKSKRKSSRRTTTTDHDSNEENYFENLNLSSRLKQAQADKAEKVFFVCYLCDKQFLSKDILKEHMHSHEEVRKALSFKKTPEKSQKSATIETKALPSGKRANKCPHCGKEYLYVISFSKHLKQHEKKQSETKEQQMPLEVSFQEDDDTLDFDNSDNTQNSDLDYKKANKEKLSEYEDDKEENRRGKRRKRKKYMESYICDKCMEKFYTKVSLRKHAVMHIPLTCNVCNEEFDTLDKLRNHRSKHVMEGVLTDHELKEDMKSVINKEEIEEEDGDEKKDDKKQSVDNQDNEIHRNTRWSETKDLKCPKCPMTYSHKKSLSRHMESHSKTKYSCKICYQQFTRKDHLRRHVEQHGRIKSFKCTQCNKTFGNELTLRNHLIATSHKTFIHGEEYDPNKRIKRMAAKAAQRIIDRIKTEDDIEDDDIEDHDNESGNRLVNREVVNETSLKKSVNRKEERLECATCNIKCSSKQCLTKHMELHVKDEKAVKTEKVDKTKKAIEKKEVEKTFATGIGDYNDVDVDSDFESGLDWPMDNHECPTCKKKYSTKKSLLRHQLLHEEPNFECDICNIKFYRKDKLKAHYDKCSEKNPDQVRKCNICGDSFENNKMLREHRAKHVTEGILTEEDLRDIEPRPEEKKQREKIVRKRRTDIVGLECTECNKHYTSRKGLLRHIQVHEGKKYLCDICPKKFYRREHLKIHVAKHNIIKPYKCPRCTKRFAKEEQLTNHLSKHDRNFKKSKETDSTKRFLCEICSKSFTQSTTLIAHLRAHNGIKPYVCEICSRPFTTNAYLKMHMRTHTQERPYICQYCSRAFARADTLANHLTSHTGEAKYHCKYCPKNFRRLKSLKEHVFIHTGQRPYACPTCDRRFNNNGSRYAHSKRCKQYLLQNQNRNQNLNQTQTNTQPRIQQTVNQTQIVKSQNIKTITIARQVEPVNTQQVMQHQEILMPLILPLTVTLADVGEEMILPEVTKIFTTS